MSVHGQEGWVSFLINSVHSIQSGTAHRKGLKEESKKANLAINPPHPEPQILGWQN
jgi:hypothetical protein